MSKKLILKNVRFSYVRVFEAAPIMDGNTNYYSVAILIPKTETNQVNEIKRALKELADEYIKYSKINHRSYKTNVAKAEKFKKLWGNKQLKEISPMDIEKYRMQRKIEF